LPDKVNSKRMSRHRALVILVKASLPICTLRSCIQMFAMLSTLPEFSSEVELNLANDPTPLP